MKASERAEPTFALTRTVIAAGLAAHAYPAAAIEVGRAAGPIWREAFGRLRYDADAAATTPDTVFDLASLTKIIATASFVMRHVERGALDLDAPVGSYVPAWDDASHRGIRIRHLLDHSSGLPAHARLWESDRGRSDYAHAVHAQPLERPPGDASVYSDLGFIQLGFVLEDLGGALDAQMHALAAALGTIRLGYRPPEAWQPFIAPTEFDPWRNRLLVGDVHDENAAALDGVAAHAGLFGTVGDVGRFAQVVLRTFSERTLLGSPATMRKMTAKTGVPESSRALGWDTMLATSSCGSRLSSAAVGHTGFTGTSLWIDREQDLYVAFLTNRVHPSRSNDAIRAIRPRVHDAVVEDLR